MYRSTQHVTDGGDYLQMPVVFQEYCKGVGDIKVYMVGPDPGEGPGGFLEDLDTELLKLEWISQEVCLQGLDNVPSL